MADELTRITQLEHRIGELRSGLHELEGRIERSMNEAGGRLSGQLHLGSQLQLAEIGRPGTPTLGSVRVYAKPDGKVYSLDDTGTEFDLTAGGGAPGGGGAPTNASYLVVGFHSSLIAERRFVVSTGLQSTDGGSEADYTISTKDSEIVHDNLSGFGTDNHHARDHALAGGTHTASGLTIGHVVRATGATSFAWQQLQHTDLGGVTENNHHNRQHVITASLDHTVTGSQWDVVGLTGSNTLGILTPSANPGAAQALLKSDASGYLQLTGFGVGTAPNATYPVIIRSSTAASQLQLQYDGTKYTDWQVTSQGNALWTTIGDMMLNPVGKDIYPWNDLEVNLGTLTKRWLTVHAAELWVQTLVAQEVMATIGGRILVGPTTYLTDPLTASAGDTALQVDHNNLAVNDYVVMEKFDGASSRFEAMQVTSGPTGSGPYDYVVVRDKDGSGANAWQIGDALVNLRYASGQGWIDIYSVSGLQAGTQYGPTIVGQVRNGTINWNDYQPGWAIGNLENLYDYATTTWGVALGEYATVRSWVSVDATNGIRMNVGTGPVTKFRVQTDGDVFVGTNISVAATTHLALFTNAQTYNSESVGAGDLLLGDNSSGKPNLLWDASEGSIKLRYGTADKLRLNADGQITIDAYGATLFTRADGIFLWGQPLHVQWDGADWYWHSSRNDRSKLGNDIFHPTPGAFPNTRGIQIESGATNYCYNPSMVDANSNNYADGWTLAANAAGAVTYSVIDHPINGMGWMQRWQYTGQAGDSGTYILFYWKTAAGSFAAGDPCTFSVDVVGYVNTGSWYIRVIALDASDTNLGSVTQGIPNQSGSSPLQRVSVTYPSLPANTNKVWVDVVTSGIDNGETVECLFGAANVEKAAYSTSFTWGDLPWCAWSGTAYSSNSTRSSTNVNIDDQAKALSDRNTLTIRCVVNAPYDANATWPSGTYSSVFDVRGADDANRIYIRYDPDDLDRFKVYIGNAYRLVSPTQTFKRGDPIDLVVTLDYASDDYRLYINGLEAATDTSSLTAPTALVQGCIGGTYGSPANQGGWIFTEVAIFDKVLSAQEVRALYDHHAPLNDAGIMDTPGIYIYDGLFRIASSHTGTRIEITPDEVAGYNGSTKQFYLQSSDGKAYAGGGNVLLDANGVSIAAGSTDPLVISRAYRFTSGASTLGYLYAFHDVSLYDDFLRMEVDALSGQDARINIEAVSPNTTGRYAVIQLIGRDASGYSNAAVLQIGTSVGSNPGGQYSGGSFDFNADVSISTHGLTVWNGAPKTVDLSAAGELRIAGGIGLGSVSRSPPAGALMLADGISAPAATVGGAIIFVDSADGDLKVRFGDGTIKLIVSDT